MTSSEDWDSRAAEYAARATALTEPFARDLLHTIAPVLALPTTRLVLDVACGGGAFALAYLTRFPRGIRGQTVRCTDVSPGMVAAARAAVERVTADTKCETHFEFVVQDATTLADIPDGAVHALVSVFGVFLVPDQRAVFEQVRRVLATDVPTVFATTAWTDPPGKADVAKDGFGVEFEATAMAVVDVCHPEMQPPDKNVDPDFASEEEQFSKWSDPAAAKRIVADAGLQNVAVWRTIHSVCTGDKHDLWVTMTKAVPMVDVSDKSDEEVSALEAKFQDRVSLSDHDGAVFVVAAANIILAQSNP